MTKAIEHYREAREGSLVLAHIMLPHAINKMSMDFRAAFVDMAENIEVLLVTTREIAKKLRQFKAKRRKTCVKPTVFPG